MEHHPVVDELYNQILMHRDAHFGGKFEIMLEYYAAGGKGAQEDFALSMIEEVFLLERDQGTNLAAQLLTGAEMEKVGRSKKKYLELRSLYEADSATPKLIADLIFSEEDEPEEEIDAIVEAGKVTIPFLLDLIRADEFYDTLFPGYGLAPFDAATCLGKMKESYAIIPIFERIGVGNYEADEQLFDALRMIPEAKAFLLKRLPDEKALLVLLKYNDEEVAKACLEHLIRGDQKKIESLLVLACEFLKDPSDQRAFAKLVPSFEDQLDAQAVLASFNL